jgi:multisubunit Na+/H+ antiporter MnhB subunit
MPAKPSSSITDPRGTSPSERIMSSPGVRSHARPDADPTWAGRQTTAATAADSTSGWLATEPTGRNDTNPWPTSGLSSIDGSVSEPFTERDSVDASTRRSRVSIAATLSLISGTLAVAATLTGLLAPLGFVAGVIGVLFGVFGLYAVRRPGINGHGLVALGLLFGLVAIAVSAFAITHSVSWISNRSDEIASVHNWLNNHFHWLRRW